MGSVKLEGACRAGGRVGGEAVGMGGWDQAGRAPDLRWD